MDPPPSSSQCPRTSLVVTRSPRSLDQACPPHKWTPSPQSWWTPSWTFLSRCVVLISLFVTPRSHLSYSLLTTPTLLVFVRLSPGFFYPVLVVKSWFRHLSFSLGLKRKIHWVTHRDHTPNVSSNSRLCFVYKLHTDPLSIMYRLLVIFIIACNNLKTIY